MCNASQGLIDRGVSQGVNSLKEAILKVRNESYSYEMLIEEGYDAEITKNAIELA